MATKNKFTSIELDEAEAMLKTWKAFMDANPYDKFEDRTKLRPTKNGGTVLEVVATIEAQQKNIRDTMKDYLQLLEVVERLRSAEASRASGTYGDVVETRRMQKKQADAEEE